VGSNIIRIGLRELTEVLAGIQPLQDDGVKKEMVSGTSRLPHPLQAIILDNLMKGRLPVAMDIIKTDEDDNDDWVEIRFGEVDPAIAPFR